MLSKVAQRVATAVSLKNDAFKIAKTVFQIFGPLLL